MAASPEATVFEAVAEATFRRHERIWKPRATEVNRGYLRKQILPRFAGRQVAEITRQDVVNWFASLRATPVAADRSMPVLSVVMREAERMGLQGGRLQSLPRHPAIPAQGPGAVPVRRGNQLSRGVPQGT